jgi:acyl-CoA synthetase (AMP-forming)/AMP-acid ligase II
MGNSDKVEKKHIQSVMSGAAPIGDLDAKRFLKRAPDAKFIQGYGKFFVFFFLINKC